MSKNRRILYPKGFMVQLLVSEKLLAITKSLAFYECFSGLIAALWAY
jgi:hypothetical protein